MLPRHQECAGIEDMKKGNQQRSGQAGANPQDQAGGPLVEPVEPPRPGVLHARCFDIQQQRPIGFDGLHRPTGPRCTGTAKLAPMPVMAQRTCLNILLRVPATPILHQTEKIGQNPATTTDCPDF